MIGGAMISPHTFPIVVGIPFVFKLTIMYLLIVYAIVHCFPKSVSR